MLYLIVRQFHAHANVITVDNQADADKVYDAFVRDFGDRDGYSAALILFDGFTAQVTRSTNPLAGAADFPVCTHAANNLGYANGDIFCLDCDGVLARNQTYADFEHMAGAENVGLIAEENTPTPPAADPWSGEGNEDVRDLEGRS